MKRLRLRNFTILHAQSMFVMFLRLSKLGEVRLSQRSYIHVIFVHRFRITDHAHSIEYINLAYKIHK